MNKRLIVPLAVFGFALGLGALVGWQLAGQAAVIALGVAIGVIVGIPVGLIVALLGVRWGLFPQKQNYATWDDIEPGVLMLTPEQSDALMGILQRPQMMGSGGLNRPTPSGRDFTVVGGANLGRGDE